MKKIISLTLVSAMTLSLVSCGGNAESSSGSEELVIWAWDQNLPIINYAIEQYQQENPDSTIKVSVQNMPDTVSKMSTFLASGTKDGLPDIVLIDNLQIQTFLQQFPDSFVNLSELGYDEYKNDFSQAHWDILSQGDSVYAFPFDIAPVMMRANTEILSEVGIDPDSLNTWDDVIAATPSIKAAGYSTHVKFTETEVLDMLQSSGVGIFDEEGNVDLLNPTAVEVIDTFLDITNSQTSDALVTDGVAFGSGLSALSVSPAWLVGEDMMVQEELNGKLKLIPLPKVGDSSQFTSSANDGGSSFIILNTSKNIDAAYQIGTHITTDLEAQKIALENGLMPGYLPALELNEVKAPIDYYQGQSIWVDLLNSSEDTPTIYVNEDYSLAKEIFKGTLVDQVNSGVTKTAQELAQETAEAIASQTGRSINQY